MKKLIVCVCTILLLVGSQVSAQEMQVNKEQLSDQYTRKVYSPFADRTHPITPLWGDTVIVLILAPPTASRAVNR